MCSVMLGSGFRVRLKMMAKSIHAKQSVIAMAPLIFLRGVWAQFRIYQSTRSMCAECQLQGTRYGAGGKRGASVLKELPFVEKTGNAWLWLFLECEDLLGGTQVLDTKAPNSSACNSGGVGGRGSFRSHGIRNEDKALTCVSAMRTIRIKERSQRGSKGHGGLENSATLGFVR